MKLLTAIIMTAAAPLAVAQGLNQEVDVEHAVVPTHRDFTRLMQYPTPGLTPVTISPLNYSQRMTPAPVTPSALLYEPAAWNDTLPTSPYKGYALAGYWPAYHLNASAGYRVIDTDHTRLSVWGQLNGANYKFHGVEHRRTSVAIGADLHQAIGQRSFLDAGLAYRFGSFNPQFSHEGTTGPVTGTWKQYVNAVDANAAWHSSVEGLKYNVMATYGHFGYYNSLPYIGWPDAESREDLRPVRENVFGLMADGRLAMGESSTVGLDLGVDIVRDGRTSTPYYYMPWGEYRLRGERGTYTHGVITLTPRYIFEGSNFTADLGVKLNFVANCGTAVHVAPDAKVTWTPLTMLTLSAKATGGQVINTLASLYEVNYLNAPMAGYRDSYVPIDFEASVMIGPRSGIYGKLFAGYSRAEDWLMPQIQGSTSFFMPQTISGWRAGVSLGGVWKQLARLEARFETAPQEYDKGYYLWRDRARYVAGADLTVTPMKQLDVSVSYELRARRAMMDRQYSLLPEPRVENMYADLRNVSDINLGGTYRYDAQWSFFLTLNNLLSRHATMVGGIPFEGFNGLLGASYKF